MFISKAPFIIAEIGLNHQGEIEKAKELIRVAKETGCSAIKFQLRSSQTFMNVSGHRDIGSEIVDEYIRRTYLDFSVYSELYEYASEIAIPAIFSAWDFDSVDFMVKLNPPAFKVASADLRNVLLIDRLIKTKKPLILSTGMSTESEIDEAIIHLTSNNVDFTLLHCHSAYPAPTHHLQLGYIKKLIKKGDFKVGYSSHDTGIYPSLLALALGAEVFEKHITLNKNGYGNDNAVSLEPRELESYVRNLNDSFEMIAGEHSERIIGPGEKFNRISLAKSFRSKSNVGCGNYLDLNNLEFYPSGEGIPPSKISRFKSSPLIKDLAAGQLITEDYFMESFIPGSLTNIQRFKGGIPVRYRDFKNLHNKFSLSFYEIHLSSGDLEFSDFKNLTDDKISFSLGFHAPDIYENNLIFDPTSHSEYISKSSIKSIENVLSHITNCLQHINYLRPVNLVTSFSCFSEESHDDERKNDYKNIAKLINSLHKKFPNIKILPQSLPALAWYLGGQRYVNTFSHPQEIYDFCLKYKIDICMDISHLIMACNYYKLDVEYWFCKLLEFSKHFHLAGASGIDDEGLNLEDSPEAIQLLKILADSGDLLNKTFIVETWQGHLNNGDGFVRDLNFISSLI